MEIKKESEVNMLLINNLEILSDENGNSDVVWISVCESVTK